MDEPCYLKVSNSLTRECLLKNSQGFYISFFITVLIGQQIPVTSPKQSEIFSSSQSAFKYSDLSQSVRTAIPTHDGIHLGCIFSALKPEGLKTEQGQRWEEGGQTASFLLLSVENKTDGRSENQRKQAEVTTTLPLDDNQKSANTERFSPMHNPSCFAGHLCRRSKNNCQYLLILKQSDLQLSHSAFSFDLSNLSLSLQLFFICC